jgi:hypothetical protein
MAERRSVARKDAQQEIDSKKIAKISFRRPKSRRNGGFLGASHRGKSMSGRPRLGFSGHDTARHAATKWLIRAIFLPTTTTGRANLYPCEPRRDRQKIAKSEGR